MQNFEYFAPTEVVFGKGVENVVAKHVEKWGGSRVLIVYGGGSAVKSGLLNTVKERLTEDGLVYEEIGGVKPNPRLSLVREGIKKGIEFKADMVLALGGGSAIDSAKAMAHGIANPDTDVWDFWTGKVELTKSMPVGVILTISAAGSEMSDSSVITNEETGKKAGLNTNFNRPKFAMMNPEFTYTIPKYQLTCGIVDIMMHTMERYFTPIQGNQLTDEIAEGLLRTVIDNGQKAMLDQKSYNAMSEIMWCSSISHNGITGLGRKKALAIHKMGHELGGKFDVAHGASLSALWGAWAICSYKTDTKRFQRFGEKVWGLQIADPEEAAVKAIERTVAFFRSLEMPVCIGELSCGVLSDEVLKELATKALGDGTGTISQFKEYKFEEVYEIFQTANHS